MFDISVSFNFKPLKLTNLCKSSKLSIVYIVSNLANVGTGKGK